MPSVLFFIVMLSGDMLSVTITTIMLSVLMENFVILVVIVLKKLYRIGHCNAVLVSE